MQIDSFVADYPSALQRAIALDNKIIGAATAISEHYADLVSLSARQVMGSLDITVSRDSQGNADASDVKIFMKDIGSSGCVGHALEPHAELTK